jgi:hypothetical protein
MAPTMMFTQTPSNEHAQRYKVLKTFQFVKYKYIPTSIQNIGTFFDVEIFKHDSMINPLLQNILLLLRVFTIMTNNSGTYIWEKEHSKTNCSDTSTN